MPFKFMSSMSPTLAFSKDAFPNQRRTFARRIKSFSLPKPAEPSCMTASRDWLLRKSSSAKSGFRSLYGREQHSSSYCARFDLRLEPFTRRALVSRNSGLIRMILRGPATLDRCCERNVVAPGEYSKGFFCVPKGLYRAILWPATALGMPARSALGAVAGNNPAPVIRAWIGPLWPSPASTTKAAPGARRPAAWGINAR